MLKEKDQAPTQPFPEGKDIILRFIRLIDSLHLSESRIQDITKVV